METTPDATLARTTVRIQGPFWAEAVETQGSTRMLLVAAGIGITPFLSVLHRINQQAEQVAYEKRNRELTAFFVDNGNGRERGSSVPRSMTDIAGVLSKVVTGSLEPEANRNPGSFADRKKQPE